VAALEDVHVYVLTF